MKNLFIFIFFAVSFSLLADQATNDEVNSWDFFGVVFAPGVPSSSNETNIGGIRVGLPVAGGDAKVAGVEFAAAACWSSQVIGIQTAPLFCVADEVLGLQASPVAVADKVDGLQFALVNIADSAVFQLGLFNYMKDGILPYTILFNFKF